MAVLTIQPDATAGFDTQLSSGPLADLNFGLGTSSIVGTKFVSKQSTNNRLLLRFDVTSIPAGAAIDSATLTLMSVGGASISNSTFTLKRATRLTWLENEATWNQFANGNTWTTPGGDTDPVNQATCVATDTTSNLVFQGSTVKNLVTDAIALRAGLMHVMVSGPEGAGADSYLYLVTSDDTNTAYRPKLVVDYTPSTLVLLTQSLTGNMQDLSGHLRG